MAAANAALGVALESIAHGNMLISRLRHSSPKRWRGAPDSRCSPLRRWRLAVGLRRFPIANRHCVGIYSSTPQRHPPSDSDYPHTGRPRSLAAYDDSLCDLAVTATQPAARPRRRPQHSCASPPTPMLTPMYPLERVPAHRRQRRCTRSNAHPQLAGTQDHRAGTVLLRAQRHRRRSHYPRSSPRRGTHATPFLVVQHLTRRYHHSRWPRRARAVHFPCSGFKSSFWPAFFAHAVFAHAHARTRPHTRTRKNDRRRTTRRAVRRRG